MSNENKPSLSKYFGDPETQAGSVFFDEIGTSPLTEQSLSADNNEELLQTVPTTQQTIQSPPTMNIFGTNGNNDLSVSYSAKSSSQQSYPSVTTDFTIPSVVSNSSTPMAAKHLPDPSKFFDMIGPGGQGGSSASVLATEYINKSLEDLSIKDNQGNDMEANRRRDAWIPDENGQKVLLQAQTSPNGSFFPERDVLTMPGIKLEEELPDALQEVAIRYLGVGEAASRGVLRAEHVTRDENGVRELIRTGYFRAAINLTGTLITAYGQGLGRSGRPTKHSPRSLQLWFTRFALFARIKLYSTLEQEAEAFGNLNKPDMYFQFYPENYGNRSGSMVPFSFRLLLAEVPLHMNKPEETLNRLYKLLDAIRNIIKNLKSGKTEDGTSELSNQQDKLESMKLWSGREARVLHSVVNCVLVLKDYRLALQVMGGLASSPHWPAAHVRALRSAMGRVCLQAGHVEGAREHFQAAGEMRHGLCPMPDMREYVDKGLLCIAQSMYPEAFENFVKAAEIEPTNIMVANNTAVCLLYMGKLKQAITVLQNTISQSPARGLDESLLLNLCTLHELECSSAADRKLSLLRALCKYRSDTIPSVSECLKLA